MADVQFILPARNYLVGVDDQREGELRLMVAVAEDPKDPKGFRRAYLMQACSVADMRSGTGSIKGLVRGVEDKVLEFDQKIMGRAPAEAPAGASTEKPAGSSVSQGVEEGDGILAEVLAGGDEGDE